ncbi:MAG: primosomal protein N' [Candidatus Cardinium sp.]|nr:primosomal protein N' [Candidatus Cardinium sp.]
MVGHRNAFADVMLPLPLKVLTYRVPFPYQNSLKVGSGVLVPLRAGKILLAIVSKLHNALPAYATQSLLAVVYTQPLCSKPQLAFLTWLADYYLATVGKVLSIGLPKSLYFPHNIIFTATPALDIKTTAAGAKNILTALQRHPHSYPALTKLVGKEAHKVIIHCLAEGWIKATVTRTIADQATASIPPLFAAALQPLAILTTIQKKTFTAIQSQFATKTVVLLYGAIGSGKTELYMHWIAEILRKQKQVLFLLPEISLLTHMIERIKPFFEKWLVVYHSKQTTAARLQAWERTLQEPTLLVVGTRSALFLPFQQLGLIIVDEEHDMAYKHTDSAPTYQARDSSIILAKQHQANVLLGSGTPSIESYYNAQSAKFGLVTLSQRFSTSTAPKFFFIDLKKEKQYKTMRENFSLTLLAAMQANSKEGGQTIIFHNRRGYACYLLCAACGGVPCCLTCSVSLTYHQEVQQLICHYCGYTTAPFTIAPCCGYRQLHNRGFGTEKVEETVQLFFPEQKIVRMDLDSTKNKTACQTLLEKISSDPTAILVGTQLIAKGLDFAHIRLVGVLDIDGLLHFPDFRANEKCFQLITQLAGRAGRREHRGKVFIQTAQPHHPLFRYLADGNYQGMYQTELAEREKFLYPPYVKLIKVTLRCTNEATLQLGATELKKMLQAKLGPTVIGPQQPLVGKVKSFFLLDFFVKIENKYLPYLPIRKAILQTTCQQLIKQKLFNKIQLLLDVDPM